VRHGLHNFGHAHHSADRRGGASTLGANLTIAFECVVVTLSCGTGASTTPTPGIQAFTAARKAGAEDTGGRVGDLPAEGKSSGVQQNPGRNWEVSLWRRETGRLGQPCGSSGRQMMTVAPLRCPPKDVADACGLPQPVIAQVVPRTWTDEGWMYTKAQVQASVGIAADLRREARRSDAGDAPGSSQ
jgi:hypothetical protein